MTFELTGSSGEVLFQSIAQLFRGAAFDTKLDEFEQSVRNFAEDAMQPTSPKSSRSVHRTTG